MISCLYATNQQALRYIPHFHHLSAQMLGFLSKGKEKQLGQMTLSDRN